MKMIPSIADQGAYAFSDISGTKREFVLSWSHFLTQGKIGNTNFLCGQQNTSDVFSLTQSCACKQR